MRGFSVSICCSELVLLEIYGLASFVHHPASPPRDSGCFFPFRPAFPRGFASPPQSVHRFFTHLSAEALAEGSSQPSGLPNSCTFSKCACSSRLLAFSSLRRASASLCCASAPCILAKASARCAFPSTRRTLSFL